jgi:hypothetical protein
MKFLTPNVGNTFEKMYRGGTPEAINSMPRPMIKYIAALNQKTSLEQKLVWEAAPTH